MRKAGALISLGTCEIIEFILKCETPGESGIDIHIKSYASSILL